MEIKEFQDMKAQIKAFQTKMEQEGKDLFKSMSAQLFDENPTLVKFGWTQYTPYYNDGDECVFSANLDYPRFLLVGQGEDLYDEEAWFSKDEVTDESIAWNNIITFLSQFSDDDVKLLFGDHAEVVVTREGVEVSQYEHD